MKRKKSLLERIKWENVVEILLTILFTYCIYTHIKINGFFEGLIVEIPMYLMLIKVFKFAVKDIRTGNWF